jgi:predicted nucleic acid-binding protein
VSWLVDTNVLSELTRRTPDATVQRWLVEHEEDLFISVLTFGELEKGVRMAADANRQKRLRAWLQNDVRAWFAGKILPIDENVATTWAEILARAKSPLPAIDSLIGATAIAHQLTVVTRDEDDIERTGAKVLNPWRQSST